jgi:RNA recognition motif-containing protein
MELFRQYAVVKSLFVVRDRHTSLSRGLAFVEFHTVEHATYALQSAEAAQIKLQVGGAPLKIAYARESFMYTQINQVLLTIFSLKSQK